MKFRIEGRFIDIPQEAVTEILDGTRIQAIKIIRNEIPGANDLHVAKELADKIAEFFEKTPTPARTMFAGYEQLATWMSDVQKRLTRLEALLNVGKETLEEAEKEVKEKKD